MSQSAFQLSKTVNDNETSSLSLEVVSIENEKQVNIILGQSHFIKSCEDIYEAIVQTNPNIQFGLAFCEASGDRLIRTEGNDEGLTHSAVANAKKISAGHCFLIFLDGGYPLNILNALKNVPEVCRIICATSNPLQVIIANTKQGRGILGVVDGETPKGVEDEEKKRERITFLRKFGYKKG